MRCTQNIFELRIWYSLGNKVYVECGVPFKR